MNNPISFAANNFFTANSFTTNTNASSVNHFWIWMFVILFIIAVAAGIYIWLQRRVQPQSQGQSEPDTGNVYQKESWCFVGEDVQGRWCIQVPSDHACDPNRTFPTRSACELVEASSMPLGVVENGGASMKPLGPMPSMSNTF